MTVKSADKRTLRTQKLLRQALFQLIEEKGLEAITVSDLTSRAEMNRGTFYLHYRDVSDLLEQTRDEVLEGWGEIAHQFKFFEIIQYADRNEPYPSLIDVFEYCNRHADFCRAILGPKGDPSFASRLKQMMKEKIYNKLAEIDANRQERKISLPPDYIIAYMTSANVGVLQHWFETGQQQSPTEVAMIMTRLVGQGPLSAFGIRPN
jgi:AcrR family transcriptional regulator